MLKLKEKKGIYLPGKLKNKTLLVAGPPGSGKSHLLKKIGGWPGEICINPTIDKWWKLPDLNPRPREIHFSLPFHKEKECHPVYDQRWRTVSALPDPIFKEVRVPKKKKFFWSPNWRARMVFDFILPPPDWTLASRAGRRESGDERLVDVGLNESLVTWQVHVYWLMAWHLHCKGLHVIVHPFSTAFPFMFSDLVKASVGKPKKARQNLFAEGVDIDGQRPTLGEWLERTAPGAWRKRVGEEKGKKGKKG